MHKRPQVPLQERVYIKRHRVVLTHYIILLSNLNKAASNAVYIPEHSSGWSGDGTRTELKFLRNITLYLAAGVEGHHLCL